MQEVCSSKHYGHWNLWSIISVFPIWNSLQVLSKAYINCVAHTFYNFYSYDSSHNRFIQYFRFPLMFHDQLIIQFPHFVVDLRQQFTSVNQQILQVMQTCQVLTLLMITKICPSVFHQMQTLCNQKLMKLFENIPVIKWF